MTRRREVRSIGSIDNSSKGPDTGRETLSLTRVEFGILVGLVAAGVGFMFVAIYAVAQLVWGSFLGVDTGIGLSLSLFVLVLGVAVATALWLGRELIAILRPFGERLADR